MFRTTLLICLALMLAACGGQTAPDGSALATNVASTLEALASATAAAASPTPLPTLALPTFTSSPAPTNTPVAGRINLATGATQAVVTGQVQANQTVEFLAGAAQGQVMIALLHTPNSSAVLEIAGADGTMLLSAATGYTNYRSVLPRTQDYAFRVVGGNSTQDFTLTVIFAVPVQFASGADSATYNMRTVGGYPITYTVYAQSGQELQVKVNTNPNDAALTIWGFDGNVFARAQNGVTNFSLSLPVTQYYIIEVVPQGGREINFQVEIEVDD